MIDLIVVVVDAAVSVALASLPSLQPWAKLTVDEKDDDDVSDAIDEDAD